MTPNTAISGRMVRATVTYTAAMILQRSASLLLLPFFAGVLSPAEFGQIGVITTIATALGILLSMGLETAIFRGYVRVKADGGDVDDYVNTLVAIGLVVPLAGACLFAMFVAEPIATALRTPVDALRLAAFGAAATAAATLGPLTIFRADERLKGYLQLTAAQVLVVPALTVIFVLIAGWGVTGWMLGYALGSTVLLVRGLMILGHRWSMRFDRNLALQAFAFGLPLLPHALSHWALSVSDRAILSLSVSDAEVGVYYIAYLFALPISLAAIAASQASQPIFAEAADSPDRHAALGHVVTLHTVGTLLMTSAVLIIGPAVLALGFPSQYSAANQYIPWLAIGTCLFGLYLMPMGAITLIAGRTQRVWIVTVAAAIANVSLNLALVPVFGATAAAVNTTIGYGILVLGVYLYMRRVCDPPLPYQWQRIAVSVVIIGVPTSLVLAIVGTDSMAALLLRLLAVMLITAALLFGPMRRDAQATLTALSPRFGRSVS